VTDTTRLRVALKDYLDALEAHRLRLREEQDHLRKSWLRTRDVYQGEGADMFEEAFRRATSVMDDYLRAADIIGPEMQQRLTALEQFDAGNDPTP
jgi:uncharacterized protein YukE